MNVDSIVDRENKEKYTQIIEYSNHLKNRLNLMTANL